VFGWHRRFVLGRVSVEDDTRSGRSSSSWNEDNVVHIRDMIREDRTVTGHMLADALHINKSTYHQILREDLGKRILRLFKRLRRWSSQTFRKRHSPAAFRTCRNAGNSVLTAEGTTSKRTGSITCEVECCIFYRLSLRTLRTKDVHSHIFHKRYTSSSLHHP